MTAEELVFSEFGVDGCLARAKYARDKAYKARCTMENERWSHLKEGGTPRKSKAYNDSAKGLSDFGKKLVERLKRSRVVFGERVNAIEAQVS